MAFYYYVATGGGKLNNLNNIIEKLVVDLIITISAYLYEHSGKTSKPISLYRLGSAILDLINEYFHPETIIKTTLEIGEKMDALPCSPGSQYRKN
ncbi:MAG TPA: hypothetical protein VLZ72_10915, partial [Flavobacterium sp.]|nr:hypothetical protein [Flavobacterium sp.]